MFTMTFPPIADNTVTSAPCTNQDLLRIFLFLHFHRFSELYMFLQFQP